MVKVSEMSSRKLEIPINKDILDMDNPKIREKYLARIRREVAYSMVTGECYESLIEHYIECSGLPAYSRKK